MAYRAGYEPHYCHARNCTHTCKPEWLMCAAHWRMVPPRLAVAVYATYRPGQCDDKRPSEEWHAAADAAIGFVAVHEGLGITVAQRDALIAAGFETILVAPR